MRSFRVPVLLSLFSLILAVTAFAEEYLYVQPFKAKIYAKPAISSEVLGSVESGFKFVAGGKEGNWVKLTYHGRNGFIPAVQTSANPPLGRSAATAAEPTKLGARARTSSSTAVVAGMKGLTYE